MWSTFLAFIWLFQLFNCCCCLNDTNETSANANANPRSKRDIAIDSSETTHTFDNADEDSASTDDTPTWMISGKFQGDIDGFENQEEFDQFVERWNQWRTGVRSGDDHGASQESDGVVNSAVRGTHLLWPNGVVPYEIGSYSYRIRSAVEAAIRDLHTHTCVRFVERTSEVAYLNIIDTNPGCYSFLGRRNPNAPQVVNLGRGCETKGVAIHELMHAIGFFHEQSRTDRDEYVQLHRENIDTSKCPIRNFDKANFLTMNLIGSYDYGSVMHYDATSCSRNGRPVMTARNSYGTSQMGNRDGMTNEDISKIRILYGCSGSIGGSFTTPLPPPNPENCDPNNYRHRILYGCDGSTGSCPSTIPASYTGTFGTLIRVCAVLYDQSNCNGNENQISAGLVTDLSSVLMTSRYNWNWDEEIASLQVNPHCSIKICTGILLTGECDTFYGGSSGKNVQSVGRQLEHQASSLYCTCGIF